MSDNLLLLLCGILGAAFAWVFWKILGEAGFVFIYIISVGVLIADNIRLRQLVKKDPSK